MIRSHFPIHFSRRMLAVTTATGVVAAAGVTAMAVAIAAPAAGASNKFSFSLKRSAGISSCLPHARGRVTITPGSLNDKMRITLHGMPPRTSFDLFVIQQPTKPFGVSWYQTDVNVGRHGSGSATVRGVFDSETFSVSPGGSTTFAPTHQYHLGLWFNNPKVPFRLGCEKGMSTPVVTPFNGRQHAGIQVLNTAQFPVNKGPLSRVHR